MESAPTIELYNEDCLEGMRRLADGSVGVAIVDLPFGITDAAWDKKIDLSRFWEQINRVLAPRSSAILFASSAFTFELYASNPSQFRYRWIWCKNMVTNFINAKNKPMNAFEDIMVFSKGVVAHAGKSNRRMKYFPQGLTPYAAGTRINYSKKKTAPISPAFAATGGGESPYTFWNTHNGGGA